MGKFEVENTPGEVFSGRFDITGFGNEFTVVVADYACNETVIDAFLNLGDHTGGDTGPAALDSSRIYGCETYDAARLKAVGSVRIKLTSPMRETKHSILRTDIIQPNMLTAILSRRMRGPGHWSW